MKSRWSSLKKKLRKRLKNPAFLPTYLLVGWLVSVGACFAFIVTKSWVYAIEMGIMALGLYVCLILIINKRGIK